MSACQEPTLWRGKAGVKQIYIYIYNTRLRLAPCAERASDIQIFIRELLFILHFTYYKIINIYFIFEKKITITYIVNWPKHINKNNDSFYLQILIINKSKQLY